MSFDGPEVDEGQLWIYLAVFNLQTFKRFIFSILTSPCHDHFQSAHQRRLSSVRLLQTLSVFVHLLDVSTSRINRQKSMRNFYERIPPISLFHWNGFSFRSPRYIVEEDAFFVLCLVISSISSLSTIFYNVSNISKKHAVTTITIPIFPNIILVISYQVYYGKQNYENPNLKTLVESIHVEKKTSMTSLLRNFTIAL